MDETDKLMEAATAMSDAADVLDDLSDRAPAGLMKSHLDVARSSLRQAVRQVEMAVRAAAPLLPASADASTPHRD